MGGDTSAINHHNGELAYWRPSLLRRCHAQKLCEKGKGETGCGVQAAVRSAEQYASLSAISIGVSLFLFWYGSWSPGGRTPAQLPDSYSHTVRHMVILLVIRSYCWSYSHTVGHTSYCHTVGMKIYLQYGCLQLYFQVEVLRSTYHFMHDNF